MKYLLKVCLTVLVIGIALVGMGQNGCPNGIGFWTNQDEAVLVGSSQPVPSAVTNLKCIDADIYAVTMAWQDNSNNEDGVLIERKTEMSGSYVEIASVDANITYFRDEVISQSTTYFYRIRAYSTNGFSMYSNEISAVISTPEPPPPPPMPPIPYNLSATSTIDSQVDLAWREAYAGWLDFPIQHRVGTDTNWSQIAMLTVFNDPEITLEFSHTGLISPTGTYYYRVGARNEIGQSDWSNEAWVIMPVEEDKSKNKNK